MSREEDEEVVSEEDCEGDVGCCGWWGTGGISAICSVLLIECKYNKNVFKCVFIFDCYA
jgi:hypothetical protein